MSGLIYGDMYKNDPYVRRRFSLCLDLLGPFIADGVSILDIGCYTADILNVINKKVNYLGLDTDAEALAIAEKKGARVLRVDFEKDPISLNEKFDIIMATELLEHLKDPQALLDKIKPLLKDDGVILVSLPNECTIYHRLKVIFGQGVDGTGFAPHYHLHFPTMRQNKDFIGGNFKILKAKYWAHADIGGFAGKLLRGVPGGFWEFLAVSCPALFARGVIYLCRKK